MTTVLIGVVLLGATVFAAYKWRPWRGVIAIFGLLAFTGLLIFAGLTAWVAIPALLAILGLGVYPWFKNDAKKANDHLVVGAVASVAMLLVVTFVGFAASSMNEAPVTETTAITAVVDGQPTKYESVSSSGPIKEQVGNTDHVVYYAYDAEAGTNNFGPALQLNKADDGLARVAEKLGSDPVFTATVIEFDQKGDKLDTATTMNRAKMYANDGQVRHNDAQAFASNIVRADLIDMGAVKYDSVGMVPDPSGDRNVMPQLTKFSTQPAMQQTLVLTMKNGRQLFFRVECDLQPSVQKFDHVAPPVTPEKPPVTPPKPYVPPTPPTQVTTTPPTKKTTTTTSPSTSTTTTTPSTSTTTTTPSTSTTTTTTETTTTTTPPETTTTTPPETTTTTTPPGKEPTKDPCVTGNDPHGCQTDGDNPITAAPDPSDPAVPEDEAPATYTTPPAPEPTTVPREDPVPTENEGAPSEAPVTGELNPGACAVCGEAEDSGNAGARMAPLAPVENGGDTDGSVTGDDGASAPVIDEDSAPAEVQQTAAPAATEASADTGNADAAPVTTVEVENKAFTSSTAQTSGLMVALLIVGAIVVGATIAAANGLGRKSNR